MSFGVRLEVAILKKYKNIKQFSEHCSINPSLVRTYVKNNSIPSIEKVKEFADLLDTSPAWLAYGVTDLSDKKENEIIDLINLIHSKVEEWLDEHEKMMDLDKKAILVKIIYKKLQLKEMKEISESKLTNSINDLIEFYSAA